MRVHIFMDPDLVARVDRAKGVGESRGNFIRRALEQALGSSSEARPVVPEDASRGAGAEKAPRSPSVVPAPARAFRPVSEQQLQALDRQRKLNERKS